MSNTSMESLITVLQNNNRNTDAILKSIADALSGIFLGGGSIVDAPTEASGARAGLKITINDDSYIIALY